MLRPPEPVIVADHFLPEHERLITLLRSLEPIDWTRPTACAGWTVHDVALHLVGGFAGNLARRRDAHPGATLPPGDDLAERINRYNDDWIQAARRFSPAVTVDLAEMLGRQLAGFLAAADPMASGDTVSWAGEPVGLAWLDLAREYTEWWHHRQHIADAVGRPGSDPESIALALRTFAFALPRGFEGIDRPPDTAATLDVTGDGDGAWSVVRQADRWRLFEGAPERPAARVTLPVEIAWRRYTAGLSGDAARQAASIEGDPELGDALLSAVAIIA
jgi:uncharacterized protein (TIGR03083 family)